MSRLDGLWAASYVVLWILVVVLSVVVVALARQIGTLHLRLGPRGALEMDAEGPPLGEAPESFDLTSLDGDAVTIGGPGHAQLVLFVSPGCHICEQVLPSVRVVSAQRDLRPYVLTDMSPEETAYQFRNKRIEAPVVPAREVSQAYNVPGTPFVVVLDEFGVVRSKGTVNNLEQMEGLIDTARNRIEENRATLRAL